MLGHVGDVRTLESCLCDFTSHPQKSTLTLDNFSFFVGSSTHSLMTTLCATSHGHKERPGCEETASRGMRLAALGMKAAANQGKRCKLQQELE